MPLITRNDLKALSFLTKDTAKRGVSKTLEHVWSYNIGTKSYWFSSNGIVALFLESAVRLPDEASISPEFVTKALKIHTRAQDIIDTDTAIAGTLADCREYPRPTGIKAMLASSKTADLPELAAADSSFSPEVMMLVANAYKEIAKSAGHFGLSPHTGHHKASRRWPVTKTDKDEAGKWALTQVGFFVVMPLYTLHKLEK